METTAINDIFDYLNEMASSFLNKNDEELHALKSRLDGYVNDVISKLPEQSRVAAGKEFEKCKECAREWICVYCDSSYHDAVKTGILKEDIMSFFFTMDERIISVQKNFFLLGMVNEIITPGQPFSEQQKEAKIANSRIRSLAREQGLKPTCEIESNTTEKAGKRLWYFGDDRNSLQSSEAGLPDQEALDYLLG